MINKYLYDIDMEDWFNKHFFLSLEIESSPYPVVITSYNLKEFKELIDSDRICDGSLYYNDTDRIAISDNENAQNLYYVLSDLIQKFRDEDYSFIDIESHQEYTEKEDYIDMELLHQDIFLLLNQA